MSLGAFVCVFLPTYSASRRLINLAHEVLSAVDVFVSKGQPPAVLLQHLTALAEGGL